MLVFGPSGVGKSTVADALADRQPRDVYGLDLDWWGYSRSGSPWTDWFIDPDLMLLIGDRNRHAHNPVVGFGNCSNIEDLVQGALDARIPVVLLLAPADVILARFNERERGSDNAEGPAFTLQDIEEWITLHRKLAKKARASVVENTGHPGDAAAVIAQLALDWHKQSRARLATGGGGAVAMAR